MVSLKEDEGEGVIQIESKKWKRGETNSLEGPEISKVAPDALPNEMVQLLLSNPLVLVVPI